MNVAAVNSVNANGVAFVFPTAPAITCGFRASRAEALIEADGYPGTLRTLEGLSYPVTVAIKGLKENSSGSSPQQVRMRRGYISYCALLRRRFSGQIKRGNVIYMEDVIWHVDAAYLQRVGPEKVRWVLDLIESG